MVVYDISVATEMSLELVAVLVICDPSEDLLEDVQDLANLLRIGPVDLRGVAIEGASTRTRGVPIAVVVRILIDALVLEGTLDLADDAAVRDRLAEGTADPRVDQFRPLRKGHPSITWKTRRFQYTRS